MSPQFNIQHSKFKISLATALILALLTATSVLVDKKMTVERVINDRLLKQAQDELRREGRLSC